MKSIFFILITVSCFYGMPAKTSEYSIETLIRSFPIGAFGKFNFGKSYKFWGDKTHQKDITYGFIRPEFEFRTSGIVNYAGGKIFIYPLPILGFFTGIENGIRGLDNLDTFDCDVVHCEGEMTRRFIGARAAIAYKRFFLSTEIRKSNIEFSKTDRPYVDEITTLLGNGDDQTTVSLFVGGIKIDENNQIGALYLKNEMRNNMSSSSMTSIIHTYKNLSVPFFRTSWENQLLSSIGFFNTRENQKVGTVLFLFKINSPKKYLLF